ncbi:MAG: DUF401 family protein [Firmicutes bacterium]|nr:DUF401 family protein [Bacillota bacterium]
MELIKLAIVFVLILILLGLRKPLWLVMLGATFLLGALFAMPPMDFFYALFRSLSSWETWELVLILWFIMILEGLMSQHGYMQRMLQAMDDLFHSKKVDAVALPMLIGFLPSAGGALFSAPIVEESVAGSPLSQEAKSIINTHFRHVMETFFPTYPGLILAAQLAQVPLFSLMLLMLPLTVFIFCAGLIFVRKVKNLPTDKEKTPFLQGIKELFSSMWPFFLLIALIAVGQVETWLASLIAMLALLFFLHPPLKEIPDMIRRSTKWVMLLMVFTVLAFKDILYACGAVSNMPEIIANLPIPAYWVFSLTSLITAVITGMELPAISLAMPLAMAAMPEAAVLPLAGLMVASAYVGAQITPMHLCITISAHHFKANVQKAILKSMPVYVAVYAVALLLYNAIA